MKVEIDSETRDEITTETLKEHLMDVERRLTRPDYHFLDRERDEMLLPALMTVLEEYMSSDDFDEFTGVVPKGDISAPQCDDEEFADDDEQFGSFTTVEIELEPEVVERLDKWSSISGESREVICRVLLAMAVEDVKVRSDL